MKPQPTHLRATDCRIYISLQPRTFEIVTQLARVMNKPRSAVISHMVEENADALAQLADALLLAKRAETEAAKVWRGDISKLSDRAHELASQADKIISDLADTIGDGSSRVALPKGGRRTRAEPTPGRSPS